MELQDQWVWITGASSGLGRAMAERLARQNRAKLIITARRAAQLEELRDSLGSTTEVVALPGDLGNPEEVDRLASTVRTYPLRAAVLNAAVTYFGPHRELTRERLDSLLQVNLLGTMRLANHLVAQLSQGQEPTRLLIVSSMAGLTPVPYQAAYSGTKAFLIAFGTALSHELRDTNLSVGLFAPGGIATEMTSGDNFKPLSRWLAPVDEVAEEGVRALSSKATLVVPGFLNRLGLLLMRFLPRDLAVKQLASTYKNALRESESKPD